MLKKQAKCKNQFAFKDIAPSSDGECEDDHGDGRYGCHEEPELQNIGEQGSASGALAEKGENQRCHAKIGEGAENGVIALQDSEGSELDNSQIVRDKVLDKDRNSLDEDIDQRYENADFDVPKCLQRAIK